MYPSFGPILILSLIFMYTPALATEASRVQNPSIPAYPESPARMQTAGLATSMERAPRKLHFRERLVLRLLEKKGLKSHISDESATKNLPGEKEKGANMNAASLGLSIGAVVISLLGISIGSPVFFLGLAAAVVGLVLGIRGVAKKYPKRGKGIAGMILSGATIVGIAIAIIVALSNFE